MIKIAVCDDNSKICNLIEDILDSYSDIHKLSLEIIHFYKVEKLQASISHGNNYNLIYLDIEFPGKSGIDLADFIRNINRDLGTEIIFISGSEEYFKRLLDFQPIAFISKPFDSEDIIRSFETFLERSNKLNLNYSYKKGGAVVIVPLKEIIYFESLGKKIYIHSERETDDFYGNLADLENELKEVNFHRIHKSYIVNGLKVRTVKKNSLVLTNDIELPISRSYQDRVKNQILKSGR